MASRAVHWHEGMFLSPQHFQAADRHLRRNLREVEDWFHSFDWGVRSIAFDAHAIANFVVVLQSCEARFKDGTRLSLGEGLDVPPLTIDLRPALTGPGETTVFIAVPSFQLGAKNVEATPTAHGPRYWIDSDECDDENTGSDPLLIQFRRPRARLLHSGDDPTGYETLPLFRVRRSAKDDALPRFDLSRVPPLLSLDAWPWLREQVQSLSYQIHGKIEQLADQAVDRGLSFRGQDTGDGERLLKLAALNEADPPLRAMVFTPGFTPLSVYVELCRIAGRLALFLPERRPPSLPAYEHENLGGVFLELIDKIRRGLEGVEPSKVVVAPLTRVGNHLQVALQDEWLQPDHKLFLGVETELSEAECDQLLRDEALDRSIGSAAMVETMFTRRLPGLSLSPLNRLPRELPARKGVVFFAIGRDNPKVWPGVVSDRSLAIRFNLDEAPFQGDEAIRARAADGRLTDLRFLLFVVPPR